MSDRFTPSQYRAITSAGSTAVSAAAGSGKTRVLTERVTRLILSGVSIDSLLVVTFTTAAAAEMRSRIMQALDAAGAAVHIDDADISTLHSFCLRIARDNYEAAEVAPGARVMDEYETGILRGEIASELFEQLYESGDEGFLRLAAVYGSYRDADKSLREFVTVLYELSVTQGDAGFAKKKLDELSGTDLRASVYERMRLDGLGSLTHAKRCLERMRELLEPEGINAEICRENVQLICSYINMYTESPELFRGTYTIDRSFAPMAYKKEDIDGQLREVLEKLNDRAKKRVKAAAELSGLYGFDEIYDAELPAMQRTIGDLTAVYEKFAAAYEQEKQRHGTLDYGDLETAAGRALSDEGVLDGYTSRLRYVFVDECQDLNPVQYRLLTQLTSGGAELFMVGDLKQAIYGFRHADPQLFAGRIAEYEAGAASVIRMNDNFRSSAGVIEFINELMSRVFTLHRGGIVYDEDEQLTAAVGSMERGAELLLSVGERGTDSAYEAEARAVAERITEMLGEPIRDIATGEIRPAKYSDMAILLRSVDSSHGTGLGAAYARELADYGIPVTLIKQAAAPDVRVMAFLSLLRLINAGADMDAAASLRSFAGLSAAHMAAVRAADMKAPLIDAARIYTQNNNDELAARLKSFLRLISDLALRAAALPLPEFLPYAATAADYELSLIAQPDGGERRRSLFALIEGSLSLPGWATESLDSYLYAVDELAREGRLSKLLLTETGADAVRIMTIHGAKGLEFPIVFLSGLHRRLMHSEDKSLMLSSRYGIVTGAVDARRRIKRPTVLGTVAAETVRDDSFSEEMRLLYVGMTRSRDRLILSAHIDDPSKAVLRWLMPVCDAHEGRENTLLDVIMPHIVGMEVTGRLAAYIPEFARTSDFRVETRLVSATGATPPERKTPDISAIAGDAADDPYVYRFADRLGIATKYSVTRLKEETAEEQPMQAAAGGGAEPEEAMRRGTYIHRKLSTLDFSRTAAEQGIVPCEYLTEADILKIDALMLSPLGRRVAAAKTVLREAPFCIGVPACEVGKAGDDIVTVQGIIDLCFVENGGWTVVDFKTDRVTPSTAGQRAQSYAVQLNWYARALEKATGLPAAQRIVWFLETGPVTIQ